jgi:hypothetical protein
MSQSSSISISCPQCGDDQEFISWHSINVSLNPEKKTELKNGTLTRFTCTHCNHTSDLPYPILYHDPERQFMIWMKTDGDSDSSELGDPLVGDFLNGYRLRIVSSRNQLVEKSHVFDFDLDDQIMEPFKVVLSTNHKGLPKGELLFAGMGTGQNDSEELQFVVLSESGTKFIGTNLKAYEDFAKQFSPIANAEPLEIGKWHRIGKAYATDLVTRYLPNAGL